MKKIFVLFIMLSMVLCVNAQKKRTTPVRKKATTTKVAASGFKNVQDLEDWLEGKTFVNSDGDVLMYSDEQIQYSKDADPEEPEWTVKNGVGHCLCAYWNGLVEVYKAKKMIKVFPRVGDVIIYKFQSEDELPSNDY